MSEALTFILLLLILGVAEISFNFVFKPSYIFGFIIIWQVVQLLVLYFTQQKKSGNKTHEPVEALQSNKVETKDDVAHHYSQMLEDTPLDNLEQRFKDERDNWLAQQHSVKQPTEQNFSHMDSHIEIAVQASRIIEELLEKQLGAYGKGLHTKLSSVESKVANHIVKSIRWMATIRNNTMHTTTSTFDKRDFIQTAQQVITYLEKV